MKWIRAHIQPVMLTLGAVALALKPEIVGTAHYGVVGWLSVGLTAAGAVGSYIAPVVAGHAGDYLKNGVAVLTAGFGAAINVAPNGFSRQDIWTIGAAIVAVGVPFLLPNTTTARLVRRGPRGDAGETQLVDIFYVLGALAFLVFIVNVAYVRFH